MKPWQSVSSRLTLTLLTLTLGSLVGLFLILDAALMRFFVQDAQASLTQQAHALATHTLIHWQNSQIIHQLAHLSSQQGRTQVMIFNTNGVARVMYQGVQDSRALSSPPGAIARTLAGTPQQERFPVTTDVNYPEWLYSTAPVRDPASNRIVGAVYVAMPLRRPKQFAQRVAGMVMGVASTAAAVAATAGLLLSRTIAHPLQVLQRQAQQLEAGNYSARSALKGNDELAHLSRLLDRMTEKLAQTLAALQERETAYRELVANVSHDLRTPLASLRLGLEAVIDRVVTGDRAQEYLIRACRETDYLSHLVEQLLLLAKADAGQLQLQPQAVSAVAIAQECIARIQPTALQAGIELEIDTAFELPNIWVDPALSGQVILNLLDNAIKYAGNMQRVCLKILPPVEQEGRSYVPIQVQDYGQGMTADVLEHVTKRFYRGDRARSRGGFGLGLAIAHQVCQLQGGLLDIESELNRGTIVTLLLPIAVKG